MLLNDYKVPGKKLTVQGSMELRAEDIAGESSATDIAEKGIKPKVLRVSLLLPYTQQDDLKSLITVAEALQESGERKIYTVTHKTANAAGVRQVRFIESIAWNENDSLMLWDISFVLQEHLSNPERVEQRTQKADAPAQDHKKLREQVASEAK